MSKISLDTERTERPGVYRRQLISYDTIRYERWSILTCALKLTSSQLNLPHGTKQKKNNEETKNKKKPEILRRNGPVVQVRGVSPEAGRESMVGKICERGIGLEAGVKVRGSYGW